MSGSAGVNLHAFTDAHTRTLSKASTPHVHEALSTNLYLAYPAGWVRQEIRGFRVSGSGCGLQTTHSGFAWGSSFLCASKRVDLAFVVPYVGLISCLMA